MTRTILSGLCALLGAALTHAATVTVMPTDSLASAVAAASAGDTITLTAGVHYIDGTISVDKDLKIIGAGPTTILSPSFANIMYAFVTAAPNIKLEAAKMSMGNVGGAAMCALATPWALQGNFSMALVNPNIRNNKVNIETDLGHWFDMRYVDDIAFANCTYTKDGVMGTNTNTKMSGYMFGIKFSTCHGHALFSVDFDKLANCGTAIDKTDPKFAKYTGKIEVWMKEYVDKISPTKNLRLPVTREGNAITILRIQNDRVAKVSATIAINYQAADLQAAITKVGVKEVDGVNTSTVVLTINLPAPYTVIGYSVGNLTLSDMNIPTANATKWYGSEACNNLVAPQTCNITATFNITACDLTGSYSMLKVPIGCQASSISDGSCPFISSNSSTADVLFFISTNNFCNVSEFNLSALFTLDVVLRTDNVFNTTRPSTLFNLGDMSYWSLRIWTNVTNVGIANAVVTKFSRASDGDCEPYTTPFTDVSTLTQTFMGGLTPPEIQNPIPVTAALTCASAVTTSNNITLTWTVLVDYLDTTARRRRREMRNAIDYRRDSGELTESKGFQALSVQGTTTEGAATPVSGSQGIPTVAIIIIIVGVLMVCMCGCCAFLGVVAWRRHQKRKEKQTFLAAQTGAHLGSSTQFGQSQMTFAHPGSQDALARKSSIGI